MYLNICKTGACLFVAMTVLSLVFLGCRNKNEQADHSPHESTEISVDSESSKVVDRPIADCQSNFLDLGIEFASLIPEKPFIKDRSKVQQEVVDTCLKLDQPVRAKSYADRISNWRMGLSYANIAYYLADKGADSVKVQQGLHLAEQIAGMDHGLEWRNAQIKVRIAQTYALIGKLEVSEEIRANLPNTEIGKMIRTDIKLDDDKLFDEHIVAIDAAIALKDFDVLIPALYAMTDLYDVYYDDTDKVAILEEKIRSGFSDLPINIRFELLVKLASHSVDRDDKAKASELITQAQEFLDNYSWPVEKQITLTAEISRLYFGVGQIQNAQLYLDKCISLFDENIDKIHDFQRAETLIPVAEVYHLIGQPVKAVEIYKLAVEQGVLNPNKRQWAEDMAQICCSLASIALEPDKELMNRINNICEELKL